MRLARTYLWVIRHTDLPRSITFSFVFYVLSLSLLAITTAAQPKQFAFDRISVQQGLPSSYVTTIYQDQQGFMWFGTDAGLARFDGLEFKSYVNNPADSSTLSSNGIWSLCEGRHGNLWVGTYDNGLNKIELKTETITRFRHDSRDSNSLSAGPIKALYVDKSGVLWIGTFGGGLCTFDNKRQIFTRMLHDSTNANTVCDNTIYSIIEDGDRILWVGTGNGVSALDRSRTRFTHFQSNAQDANTLSDKNVVSMYEDNRGALWFGTRNGLNRYDKTTRKFTRFFYKASSQRTISNNQVYAIGHHIRRDDTTLWFGTRGGGLNLWEENTRSFVRYQNDESDKRSLADDDINSLFTDNTGALWIATTNGGVNKISKEDQPIRHLRHEPAKSNTLTKGSVYSLAQDSSGNIWAGILNGGLDKYNPRTGAFRHYDNLGNQNVTALLVRRNGELWIGVEGMGITVLRNEKVVAHYNASQQSSINSNTIDEMYEGRDGAVWIATSGGGLNLFDPATKTFSVFVNNPNDPASISHNRLTAIYETRDQNIWLATEGGGLNMFDKNTRKFTVYKAGQDSGSLSNDLVYALCEDAEGALWVGTANGLNRFDRTTRKCLRYFREQGISSDYIKGILEDASGNIWLITSRSISRLSPDRKTFVNFDQNDGFINISFTDARFKNALGEICIGGTEGIDMFNPKHVVENTNVPRIALTEYKGGRPNAAAILAVPFLQNLSGLSWTENTFSFTFACLDFTNPSKNQYRYTMVREDDNTLISAGTRRFADITNLDNGKYTFTAFGANNNGIWNNTGTSLQIEIDPPIWKTKWFVTLAALVVIGILAIIYNVRVSQLLAMEKLKTRIASDLHDEVGSSLSAVALITDMVRRKLPMQSQEFKHLTTATEATRTTTDTIRDLAWVLNPQNEKNSDISLRMKDIASRMLAATPYSFDAGESPLAPMPDMEFRWNVLMIFKEALNNTAKYSKASHVGIHVRTDGELFSLKIEDNGVGFDIETVRKGNGYFTQKARAEKIGGVFEIDSAPGAGTKTELRAKIPQSRYDMYEAFHRMLNQMKTRFTNNDNPSSQEKSP